MRIGEEKDSELQDILEDKGQSTELNTEREFLCQELDKLLLRLTPQQREILTLRFGLIDGKQLTLAQIGQRMGVSREHIRRIEKQALSKLKKHGDEIRSYLAS